MATINAKTIDNKTFTLSLNRNSETTGQQIKQLLLKEDDFKNEDMNEYILLFSNEILADNHCLHDHQVILGHNPVLDIIKTCDHINKTLIAQYKKRELIAKQPSVRLMHLITGYIREKSTHINAPVGICTQMVHFIGNKLPTFSIQIGKKTLHVSEKWLVKNLKTKLAIAPYHNVKYRGKTLKNYHTLEHYNIGYNKVKTTDLSYFCHQLYLRKSNGVILTLDLWELNFSLLQCKQFVFGQHKVSVKKQKWIWHGRVMDNDEKNIKYDYKIPRDALLDLKIS